MRLEERFELKRIGIKGNIGSIYIITDSETGVSYLSLDGNGSLTVIVDKDGKPYIPQ
jgi:hypothetical protein